MRTIDTIIIHSSATPRGMSVHAKDIDKWHRERGFRCIGYHFVITATGNIETGRPVAEQGAHAYGHNTNSIGICYVGGTDAHGNPVDTRTPTQKESIISLIKMLLRQYPTIKEIVGHRDVCPTACPSFDAKKEYQYLINK